MLVKPMFGKSTYPIFNHSLVANGKQIQSTGDHWWVTRVDYFDPPMTIKNAAITQALKIDKVVKPVNGALKVGTSTVTVTSDLHPENFPEVPDMSEARVFVIPGLADAIKRISHAMADMDVRYYLNGFCFEVLNKYVRVIATDGHRLAYEELGLLDSPDMSIIVRQDFVKHINSNQIAITTDFVKFGENFVIRTVDGNFPNYRRILPNHELKVTFNRKDLLNILSPLLGRRKKVDINTELIIGKNSITTKVHAEKDVVIENEIPCSETQEEQRMGLAFNLRYLVEMLKSYGEEEIEMTYKDKNSAARFNTLEVIMPIRMKK